MFKLIDIHTYIYIAIRYWYTWDYTFYKILRVERDKPKQYYEIHITPKGILILSHLHIIVNILRVWPIKYTTPSHSKSKTVSNNDNVTYIYFNSFVQTTFD